MQLFSHKQISPQSIQMLAKNKQFVEVFILRLDEIHPVISGNKVFKLQHYLAKAVDERKKRIITWGGAFSNHIIATAAAAKEMGLLSVGLIRGEQPTQLSITLQQAIEHGMQLHFLSRENYRSRILPIETDAATDLIIEEGGYGEMGAKGAEGIADLFDANNFTDIICAVGTGTMLAGLSNACGGNVQITGISSMKNNLELEAKTKQLIYNKKANIRIFHNYHFGGYAKQSRDLFDFMNSFYSLTAIPTDFVYTGKLLFAVNDLLVQNFFKKDSRLLVIHSGGLQGNRSLMKGKLIF